MENCKKNRRRFGYGLAVNADRLFLLTVDVTTEHEIFDPINGLCHCREIETGETEPEPWDELLNVDIARLRIPISTPQFISKMSARSKRRNIENETTGWLAQMEFDCVDLFGRGIECHSNIIRVVRSGRSNRNLSWHAMNDERHIEWLSNKAQVAAAAHLVDFQQQHRFGTELRTDKHRQSDGKTSRSNASAHCQSPPNRQHERMATQQQQSSRGLRHRLSIETNRLLLEADDVTAAHLIFDSINCLRDRLKIISQQTVAKSGHKLLNREVAYGGQPKCVDRMRAWCERRDIQRESAGRLSQGKLDRLNHFGRGAECHPNIIRVICSFKSNWVHSGISSSDKGHVKGLANEADIAIATNLMDFKQQHRLSTGFRIYGTQQRRENNALN
ncbi:MAG TPA: hypothetical protein VGK58_22280 [Lacipirellulaceae bacterium]